jgi:HEAT repeat protein
LIKLLIDQRKGMTRRSINVALLVGCLAITGRALGIARLTQGSDHLTPMQSEIERQRQRLSSAEIEARRDALMRLANLKRPEASRVAASGLTDPAPVVRATAVHAVLALPPAEGAALLLPLLQDKSEFVRRETAYALGETHSRSAVEALSNLLLFDKEASVRAAAAIALGQIGDGAAVNALSQVLRGDAPTKGKKKKAGDNEFVMRAAAHSLGQIRSQTSVTVLIAALDNQTNANDVRREAATALGLIGDPSAIPSLRAALASADPYLSEAVRDALRRLRIARN